MLDLPRDALLAAGVAADRLYEDVASGRHEAGQGWRPVSKPCDLRTPWWSGSSIGSGAILRHLVTLVEDLRHRDVGLKVLAGHGAQIDTTTANGRLVFGIFAAVAEFEAELTHERTRAGLVAARRPPPEDDPGRPPAGHGRAGGANDADHRSGPPLRDPPDDGVSLCPWRWLPHSPRPRPPGPGTLTQRAYRRLYGSRVVEQCSGWAS